MDSNDSPHATQPRTSAGLVPGLLLAFSAIWCVYWFVHAWNYWEDDAYIHLEFARSLASGQGFAFNGHAVAGDTAPLWVLLLAGVHAFIPDWLVAGKVLTAFAAFFGFAGIYRFAQALAAQLLPSSALLPILPAAILVLTAVNPYTCYWIFSGMEPIAAAGLACFATLAATRERPTTASFLTACSLAGLAPLLRPEMAFLTALLFLPIYAQARRMPASGGRPVLGLILLIAPLALWSLYSLHAFGHLMPNTNAAKRAGPHDSVVLRLLSAYSLGFPVIVCGLLGGIACLCLRPGAVLRSLGRAVAATFAPAEPTAVPLAGWIFLLWPLVAAGFYIANHTYVQTRYIYVSAPGLTIVILLLALRAFPFAGRVLYLLALAGALLLSIVTVRPFVHNKGTACIALRDLALFIRDRIPPDAPVATYVIGEVAFVSQHPLIDTGGITRPGAIPYLNDPLPVMARWAQSQGAQYYIESKPLIPGSRIVYQTSTPFLGWTLNASRYATSDPLEIWKLPPPSPASN